MTPCAPPSVVHILWSGDTGGAERAVLQLALQQRRERRAEVALGFGRAEGPYADLARERGLRVLDFGMRGAADLAAALRARRPLRDFDVHHFHGAEPALMIASLASTDAVRIYTHRAGVASYSARQARRYRIAGRLIRRFDAVTGTDQAAAAAERAIGVPATQVARTFNGVDLGLFEAGAPGSVLRAQRDAPADRLLIGTAANLRAWKRIDWLIGAAAQLRSDRWELWILGDGEDRARLEGLAVDAGVADRTRFLGMQPRIADWLRCLDVFVLPSGPEESFGNAVVEAMACGVPTIVTADCPAHTEHVRAGVTGMVARDREDLVTRLDELLGDPELRARLGEAGRRFVLSTYPMERASARVEEIYAAARADRDIDRLRRSGRAART